MNSHNENINLESEEQAVHEEAQEEHGHTLYAEPIGHIGSFTVTNSLLNSWLVVILLVVFAISFKNKIKTIPGKFQSILEMVIDYLLGIFDSVTNDRKKSSKFFPLIFTFFLFILLNNWLGILPGVGSIGKMGELEGHTVFIPFFRGATADLNTTLALAILGIVASHIFGVLAIGGWNYFNKFINIKAFLEIPKKVLKDPAILIVNPIKAFIGLIEIIGEFSKMASLAFRLYGNIFAGEVLLASMSAILAFGIPIPFMFLEIIVGAVQALIFSVLILSYFSIAVSEEEH
jgi:F-type H+-transporting ATPase subunit a